MHVHSALCGVLPQLDHRWADVCGRVRRLHGFVLNGSLEASFDVGPYRCFYADAAFRSHHRFRIKGSVLAENPAHDDELEGHALVDRAFVR